MAGRKHHHVPQLLQRGFARKRGKAAQVFVYSSVRPPYPTNTANFGAERDFYAEGEDFTIDDQITGYEEKIAPFISSLRALEQGALERKDLLGLIVAHLEIRTAFLREELSFITHSAMTEFGRALSEKSFMERFLKNYLKKNPTYIREEIEKLGVPAEALDPLTIWFESHADQHISAESEKLAEMFRTMMASFGPAMAEIARKSHLKALARDISPTLRAQTYSAFNFTYLLSQGEGFILPDTMICFATRKRPMPFLEKLGEAEEIFFPVSDQCIVIGTRRKWLPRQPSEVNRILAGCAFNRFVAAEQDASYDRLTSKIGRNATLLGRDKLFSMLKAALRDSLR